MALQDDDLRVIPDERLNARYMGSLQGKRLPSDGIFPDDMELEHLWVISYVL